VGATRAADDATLAAASAPRVRAMIDQGATTVEIKSGYGLDTANELKQLRVARALGAALDVDVKTTLLAAHALPPEYADRADVYIDYVCGETIPAAAREGVADAVDAFCETIGFTARQTRRVFEAARAHGLPVKLHADQLSDTEGARIAADFGALSADHLEYTNDAGIAAMAKAGTVAVPLPGAFYALRETRVPPVDGLREHRVPIAISTDCNPGTSPATSLPLRPMSMAHVPPDATRGAGGRRIVEHRRARGARIPDRRASMRGRHSRRPFRAKPRLTCCSGTSPAAIRR
jgi:imidazolonepropionase